MQLRKMSVDRLLGGEKCYGLTSDSVNPCCSSYQVYIVYGARDIQDLVDQEEMPSRWNIICVIRNSKRDDQLCWNN